MSQMLIGTIISKSLICIVKLNKCNIGKLDQCAIKHSCEGCRLHNSNENDGLEMSWRQQEWHYKGVFADRMFSDTIIGHEWTVPGVVKRRKYRLNSPIWRTSSTAPLSSNRTPLSKGTPGFSPSSLPVPPVPDPVAAAEADAAEETTDDDPELTNEEYIRM